MTSELPWDLSSIVPLLMEFRHERDWEQFHRPKELAAAIAIEAAELQELFLWKEGESAREIRNDDERMGQISGEIADILIYLLYLANDLEVDLQRTVMNKIEKNKGR
jgi:NTP pyrophosphatase (non-canonical NTP hydrolase)